MLTGVEEVGNGEAQEGLEPLWNTQRKVGNSLEALNFTLEARADV